MFYLICLSLTNCRLKHLITGGNKKVRRVQNIVKHVLLQLSLRGDASTKPYVCVALCLPGLGFKLD